MSMFKAMQIKSTQSIFDNARIICSLVATKPLPVGRSTKCYDLPDGQGKIAGLLLQYGGNALRDRAGGQGPDVFAINQNCAGFWTVIPIEHAQQSCLARTIGAYDSEHAARFKFEAGGI